MVYYNYNKSYVLNISNIKILLFSFTDLIWPSQIFECVTMMLLFWVFICHILTFSKGLTTANKKPPSIEFSLKLTTMENSEYNFSGRNNRYGDFISDPGLMPNAGNPSSPLSKYSCGSSNGTLMAVWRSCSSEKWSKM